MNATTIVCVRRDGRTAMASDGQVTLGALVVKHQAAKVRRLHEGRILAGFAGSAADGLALVGRFETKLQEHRGQLERAAVELAREWRTDKVLRQLDAAMIVADRERMFLLSGSGDLLQPDDAVLAIGSGGGYALAAAKALLKHTALDAGAVAREALLAAAEICIYTNDRLTLEVLE
jgi:ATP-dependent HslUV protease subunit HslV